MKFIILTIFPEIFPGPLASSLIGKALKDNKWSLEVVNIREFGLTKHKKVDDTVYGGGNGLVLRPDVLGDALDHVRNTYQNAPIYYPSPRGVHHNQGYAKKFMKEKEIIFLCGRFEGIDERVIDEYNIQQISIGDYILAGGEVACLAIMESIIRLIPGVIANEMTLKEESFELVKDEKKLIEHPLYTKPAIWRGRKVPDILLSGNHAEIDNWRLNESVRITDEKGKK